ncbi:MAG: polyprenol monophosphomannose synthase [Flavobacteriaceae bacterium]|nr:polyprenol monophosphomannose synthase [Flavobacteriaceae bacterium]
MRDSIVVIPTFNEIENIETVIRTVFNETNHIDILVVDDNSPDKTANKVIELQKEFKDKLFLEVRSEKSGLGTAYIHGFKWCLFRHYDYIFEMDADLSHNPKDLNRLYEKVREEADIAIGSRYVKGVNVVNWPLGRILLSYGASMYVRLITGMRIKDPTAGFIVYKREVLEQIDLDKIQFVGYAFQIEMKYKAFLKNFKIIEVPIIFTDRIKGQSKMSSNIISEAVLGVLKLRMNSTFK